MGGKSKKKNNLVFLEEYRTLYQDSKGMINVKPVHKVCTILGYAMQTY